MVEGMWRLLGHTQKSKEPLMPSYRKKPVVIEAEQFTGGRPVAGMCKAEDRLRCYPLGGKWHVHTLEGVSYKVVKGDWIIKGVKGEFYPCTPDVFEASYESD